MSVYKTEQLFQKLRLYEGRVERNNSVCRCTVDKFASDFLTATAELDGSIPTSEGLFHDSNKQVG